MSVKDQRFLGKEAQPDSGPAIIRFRGVDRPVGGGPSTDIFNKRLKWDGSNWVVEDGPAEDHNTALYDGDTERILAEGEEVYAIWRNPARRWQILTSDSPTILLGQATTAVSAGTSSFSVDNIIVSKNGVDPRTTPGSPSETIAVTKLGGGALENNDWVMFFQAQDDLFYADRLPDDGTGGGTAVGISRFELTANLTQAGTTVAARKLNDDGTVEGTAITLTDANAEWFGYGPYTAADNSVQPGFRGIAIKYDDGGNERWYIVHMETLAPGILVRLAENAQTSPTRTLAVFISIHGTPSNYRLPIRATPIGVDVFDDELLGSKALSGQKWICNWRSDLGRYVLEDEPESLRIIRGSVVTADVEDGDTFSVDSLVLVNGRLPVDSTNGNPLTSVSAVSAGFQGTTADEVYLEHDRSRGSDETDMWVARGGAAAGKLFEIVIPIP